MSARAVAVIRPVPISSQATVPSDAVRTRRLDAYQELETWLNTAALQKIYWLSINKNRFEAAQLGIEGTSGSGRASCEHANVVEGADRLLDTFRSVLTLRSISLPNR